MRGLVYLLGLLALGGSLAVAEEADVPAWRLALGPTSVMGRFSAEIADHFDARLDGIQDCASSIQGWQAPDPGGWVASFHTRSDERGKLLEFGWNSGHALPVKVRRCVAKRVRAMPFPSLPSVGYLHVQQVVWVLPVEGDLAPLRDQPVAEQLGLEELQAGIHPFRRDIDECMLANTDDHRTRQKQGWIVVWFAVRPDGLVASTSVAGVNKPWVMHANCVASWIGKAGFERTGSTAPRLGGVRVYQANLFVSARSDPKRSRLPKIVRFPVEAGSPEPDAAEEETGVGGHTPTVLPEPEPVNDETAPLLNAAGRYEGSVTIEYPELARQAGIEGVVPIVILVGVDGVPVRRSDRQCERWWSESPRHWSWHLTSCAAATDGPVELHQSALDAWTELRFTPVEVNGRPGRHRLETRVRFWLRD